MVYPESQSFYCFGCGAGGDAISFIMRAENLEYIEAVKLLAEKAGLPMPENTAEDRTGKCRMRILEMNREAERFLSPVPGERGGPAGAGISGQSGHG